MFLYGRSTGRGFLNLRLHADLKGIQSSEITPGQEMQIYSISTIFETTSSASSSKKKKKKMELKKCWNRKDMSPTHSFSSFQTKTRKHDAAGAAGVRWNKRHKSLRLIFSCSDTADGSNFNPYRQSKKKNPFQYASSYVQVLQCTRHIIQTPNRHRQGT